MPAPAGVLAPLLLIGVLAVSALAKWREPASTVSAITLLRLPTFLQKEWVAKALPIGELVLCLLMLAPWLPIARVASWAALALFLTYLGVIGRAMTFTPRPSCGCFGRIGDQRVRAKTVWRNALFVAVAGVFVWFTAAGHTVPSTLADLGTTGWAWVLGAIVVATAIVLIGAGAAGVAPTPAPQHQHQPHDQHAHPHPHGGSVDEEASEEDYVREPIPSAMLVDPDGTPHRLLAMSASRAQVLVFVNCYCGPTHTVAREIPGWRERMPQVDIRLVFSGVEPMEHTEDTPTKDAWRDHSGITWEKLDLRSSPSAVLLGADGLLAGGPVNGLEDVQAFVEEIADALSEAPLPDQVDAADDLVEGEIIASR